MDEYWVAKRKKLNDKTLVDHKAEEDAKNLKAEYFKALHETVERIYITKDREAYKLFCRVYGKDKIDDILKEKGLIE